MDAAVFEFILRGFADGDDFDIEVQCFPRERVVAVDVDIFFIDGDDPEGEGFSVFRFCGHARTDFELCAFRENRFGDSLRFAVAQAVTVFWGDIDVEVVVDFFALEGIFEAAQDHAVPMHVTHWVVVSREVEDFAFVVAEDKNDGRDGIFGNCIGSK